MAGSEEKIAGTVTDMQDVRFPHDAEPNASEELPGQLLRCSACDTVEVFLTGDPDWCPECHTQAKRQNAQSFQRSENEQ